MSPVDVFKVIADWVNVESTFSCANSPMDDRPSRIVSARFFILFDLKMVGDNAIQHTTTKGKQVLELIGTCFFKIFDLSEVVRSCHSGGCFNFCLRYLRLV